MMTSMKINMPRIRFKTDKNLITTGTSGTVDTNGTVMMKTNIFIQEGKENLARD